MSTRKERRGEPGQGRGHCADKHGTVLAQIVALEDMPFADLKEKYRALYDREPPSRSRKQVIARLAYRIQEIAYGGLSLEARERLVSIGEAHGVPGIEKEQPKERKGAPAIGTKLVREYLGERHEVVVLDKGFQYRDRVYRSLSAVAREISGSHVSGPAFFGVKKEGAAR